MILLLIMEFLSSPLLLTSSGSRAQKGGRHIDSPGFLSLAEHLLSFFPKHTLLFKRSNCAFHLVLKVHTLNIKRINWFELHMTFLESNFCCFETLLVLNQQLPLNPSPPLSSSPLFNPRYAFKHPLFLPASRLSLPVQIKSFCMISAS